MHSRVTIITIRLCQRIVNAPKSPKNKEGAAPKAAPDLRINKHLLLFLLKKRSALISRICNGTLSFLLKHRLKLIHKGINILELTIN